MRRNVIGIALLLASGVAFAAEGPDAIVDYREAVMKTMSGHLKASGMIAKGKVQGRDGDLVAHASALQAASVDLCGLFPADTAPGKVKKTEAKAEIWSKPDEFKKACDAYAAETTKLVEVAKTGDKAAFLAQHEKVGATCGSCHDSFKVKD